MTVETTSPVHRQDRGLSSGRATPGSSTVEVLEMQNSTQVPYTDKVVDIRAETQRHVH